MHIRKCDMHITLMLLQLHAVDLSESSARLCTLPNPAKHPETPKKKTQPEETAALLTRLQQLQSPCVLVFVFATGPSRCYNQDLPCKCPDLHTGAHIHF